MSAWNMGSTVSIYWPVNEIAESGTLLLQEKSSSTWLTQNQQSSKRLTLPHIAHTCTRMHALTVYWHACMSAHKIHHVTCTILSSLVVTVIQCEQCISSFLLVLHGSNNRNVTIPYSVVCAIFSTLLSGSF